MKKNALTLILFLLLGLLAASIVTGLLEPVKGLSPILASKGVSWSPAADLGFLKYNIHFEVKLNLVSLVGIGVAIWLYRKL